MITKYKRPNTYKEGHETIVYAKTSAEIVVIALVVTMVAAKLQLVRLVTTVCKRYMILLKTKVVWSPPRS